MSKLMPMEYFFKRYEGKYVVALAVRDESGMAKEFKFKKAFLSKGEAGEYYYSLFSSGCDAVVIPCFTTQAFDEFMTESEIAFVFRLLYNCPKSLISAEHDCIYWQMLSDSSPNQK